MSGLLLLMLPRLLWGMILDRLLGKAEEFSYTSKTSSPTEGSDA